MIKEALQYFIEKTIAPTYLDEFGREYQTDNNGRLDIPAPDIIDCASLDGFIRYAKDIAHNDVAVDYFMVTINRETLSISLVTAPMHANRDRITLCRCTPPIFSASQNHPIPIEAAIIQLQTHFADSADKTGLLRVLGSISTDEVKQADDDGVCQTVTIKNKVGRLEMLGLKPIVELRRYCTYPELEPPERRYLLRFHRHSGGDLPLVSLTECQDQHWRIEAAAQIKRYLNDKMAELIVVA